MNSIEEKEDEKYPKIRFNGFADEWEQRKFKDVFIEKRETTKQENEDVLLSCAIDGIFLNSELFGHFRGSTTVGYLRVKRNDLILSAQNLHLGNANVNLIFEHGIISPAYKVYELNNCDPKFIQSWVKKDDTKNFFLSATTEGASKCRKNIDWNLLGEQTISMPAKAEQQQIGDLFSSLDSLILFYQEKHENLVKLKKSMLNKMFPKEGKKVPEIRFEGFTDDWEQRKLSDAIVDIADGPFGSNLKTEHYTDEKEARIIQLSNLSDYGWQEPNTRYTTFEHAKEIRRCIVNEGELVMGKMMPAGMTIIRPNTEKMYVLSSDCVRIKLDKNVAIDKFFLYTTKSEAFLNQVNNDSQGSTRVRTSVSKIREMDFATPSLEEQAKIGEYFTNLDNLITLHQLKYEKLLDVKKAMLSKLIGGAN